MKPLTLYVKFTLEGFTQEEYDLGEAIDIDSYYDWDIYDDNYVGNNVIEMFGKLECGEDKTKAGITNAFNYDGAGAKFSYQGIPLVLVNEEIVDIR